MFGDCTINTEVHTYEILHKYLDIIIFVLCSYRKYSGNSIFLMLKLFLFFDSFYFILQHVSKKQVQIGTRNRV